MAKGEAATACVSSNRRRRLPRLADGIDEIWALAATPVRPRRRPYPTSMITCNKRQVDAPVFERRDCGHQMAEHFPLASAPATAPLHRGLLRTIALSRTFREIGVNASRRDPYCPDDAVDVHGQRPARIRVCARREPGTIPIDLMLHGCTQTGADLPAARMHLRAATSSVTASGRRSNQSLLELVPCCR